MPVHRALSEHDSVGPYNRLSASQANTYLACPRLWFYQKVYRFKMPQIPVLFIGRAVEEALCRVLRDSPSLVAPHAPSNALGPSPYRDNGEPEDEHHAAWPAPKLMPLFPSERPSDKSSLTQWAHARCRVHLPVALEAMKEAWQKDERRAGDWSEVDEEACVQMVLNGVDFHLKEVERCFESQGGPSLQTWREGERPPHPAPDGFPFPSFAARHPLAEAGEITWPEAWEIARPWFVDPDAPGFTMNAIHPEHWFQGEYDLVYRWTGSPSIVDIKASLGANDRSGDYVEQMRDYAMLWYVTHGRKESVSGLEIWYLKHPSIKSVPVPTEDEITAIENELEGLWKEIRQRTPSMDECPPKPRPMRGFSAGGVPAEAPDEIRCDRCDWRSVCPGGEGQDDPAVPPSYQLPGTSAVTRFEAINTLDPRTTIRGVVFSVGRQQGNRPQTVHIKQDTYDAQVQIVATEDGEGQPTVAVNLERGASLLIRDAVFSVNWKGEIVLKIDPLARVEADTDPTEASSSLFDKQAKHNIAGIVVYTYEKSGVGKTGKRWSRKGMMVMDASGATKVEGWADDWNAQYDLVCEGDTVALANLGLDAWANDVRGDYTRQSTLQIIARVDRSTA
jgi:hypothetical protein